MVYAIAKLLNRKIHDCLKAQQEYDEWHVFGFTVSDSKFSSIIPCVMHLYLCITIHIASVSLQLKATRASNLLFLLGIASSTLSDSKCFFNSL